MTNKFNKTKLEIIERLLAVANRSDWFIDNLPTGCKTLEDVWSNIDSIENKLKNIQSKK